MARRTSAMGSRRTLARFLSQNRITGTVREIAKAHEINRQNVVKELLVHVFLMSKFKILTGGVAVGEAKSQYISGHGNDQAAHCVPGQITNAAGQPIQNLLLASDDLHVAVDNLFGTTDEIDANFNKADSSSEENGLRTAFGNACEMVFRTGAHARFNRAFEFHHYIHSAFERYKNDGMQAFRTALARQQALMANASGADLASRQERLLITQIYLNTLSSAPVGLETVWGLDTEELWRDYREIAP